MARKPYELGDSIKIAHADEVLETVRAVRVLAIHERLKALESRVERLKADWPDVVEAHIRRLEERL